MAVAATRPETVPFVGRQAERRQIDGLLQCPRRGRSGTLLVRGEAGIGKTALLRYAIGRAKGMSVLHAQGVASESDLPYAGLSELLRPLLDRIELLPGRRPRHSPERWRSGRRSRWTHSPPPSRRSTSCRSRPSPSQSWSSSTTCTGSIPLRPRPSCSPHDASTASRLHCCSRSEKERRRRSTCRASPSSCSKGSTARRHLRSSLPRAPPRSQSKWRSGSLRRRPETRWR